MTFLQQHGILPQGAAGSPVGKSEKPRLIIDCYSSYAMRDAAEVCQSSLFLNILIWREPNREKTYDFRADWF